MLEVADRVQAGRWSSTRRALEAAALALVALPALWLLLHWPAIPALSPHLRHSRAFLWIMPAYAFAVYLVLSEFGLLARMHFLQHGQSLARLRPIFLAYLLVTRLQILALLAVLSLAMDRTAVTGIPWPARGFITASLVVICLTILLFVYLGARAAYTGQLQQQR